MTTRARTGTIGVLAPYTDGPYYGRILNGVRQALRRHGLDLLVVQGPPGYAAASALARNLVDCWVAVSDVDGVDLLKRQGAPIVVISAMVEGLPAVLPDNRAGMRAATLHLIDHGHQRLAFVGRQANVDVRQRLDGFQAALAERGIALDERLLIDTPDEAELGGFGAARQLIELGMPCTAIVASTDRNAFGVLECLRTAGYRVPEDLALVGFDDVNQAQTSDPPLTTVRQLIEAIGGVAGDLAQALVAGQPVAAEPIYVPTALITRRSCGCAQTGPVAAPAELSGADGDRLRRELVRLLLHPLAPDPARAPEQIWPGVAALSDALDAAVGAAAVPTDQAVAAAVLQMLELNRDLTALEAVLRCLDQRAQLLLGAAARPDEARPRMLAALQLIRRELLRARIALETTQVSYLDSIILANNQISLLMLGADVPDAPPLSWMHLTELAWGYLGLWTDATTPTLSIVSVFEQHDRPALAIGSQHLAAEFPPPGLAAELSASGPADTLLLLPIRTARRDWGVLALYGQITGRISSTSEATAQWAGLLGTALDRAALLAELTARDQALQEQQATLRQAYERERLLADTVREIGSPVIPLLANVLLIPVVGAIDTQRAQQIIAAVLEGVGREQATDVLVDITAVPVIDTQVANALIQMARMTQLLGARTTLVGVRPEIAQSIVSLGLSLSDISTEATLASALQRMRRRV